MDSWHVWSSLRLSWGLIVPTSDTWEAVEERNVFNLGIACYRLVWPWTPFPSPLGTCCRGHRRGSCQAKWHCEWPCCWTSVSSSVMVIFSERVKELRNVETGLCLRAARVQMHLPLLLLWCPCPPLLYPPLIWGTLLLLPLLKFCRSWKEVTLLLSMSLCCCHSLCVFLLSYSNVQEVHIFSLDLGPLSSKCVPLSFSLSKELSLVLPWVPESETSQSL